MSSWRSKSRAVCSRTRRSLRRALFWVWGLLVVLVGLDRILASQGASGLYPHGLPATGQPGARRDPGDRARAGRLAGDLAVGADRLDRVRGGLRGVDRGRVHIALLDQDRL